MFIKIMESSPLGLKIREMWTRGKDCNSQALNWAKAQGAQYIRGDMECIFGGVLSAKFTETPPKGWVKAGPRYESGEYLISSKTKEGKLLKEQEQALPRITDDEFNALFNYEPWECGNGRQVQFHPGLQWGENGEILLSFSDYVTYTPVEHMEEITATEYKKLIKKYEKK